MAFPSFNLWCKRAQGLKAFLNALERAPRSVADVMRRRRLSAARGCRLPSEQTRIARSGAPGVAVRTCTRSRCIPRRGSDCGDARLTRRIAQTHRRVTILTSDRVPQRHPPAAWSRERALLNPAGRGGEARPAAARAAPFSRHCDAGRGRRSSRLRTGRRSGCRHLPTANTRLPERSRPPCSAVECRSPP